MHTYTLLARPHRAFQSQCYNNNLKKTQTHRQRMLKTNNKKNKLKETSSGSHLSLRLKLNQSLIRLA